MLFYSDIDKSKWFLIREVAGGRKNCYEYIFLKKSFMIFSNVIIVKKNKNENKNKNKINSCSH